MARVARSASSWKKTHTLKRLQQPHWITYCTNRTSLIYKHKALCHICPGKITKAIQNLFFPPTAEAGLEIDLLSQQVPNFTLSHKISVPPPPPPAMCNCSNHYLDVQCSLYTDLKQQSSTRHQLLLSLSLLSLFNSQSQLFHCIAHSVAVNSTVFSCSSDDQTDGKDQGLQLSHSH